jgi:predicted phage tail protein
MNAIIPRDTVMKTCEIHLHGKLRTHFGESVVVPGSTVSSAIRNMLIVRPEIRFVLEEGEYRVVRGSLDGGIDLDASMLHMQIGPARQIHLFPVAAGGGGGGGNGGTLKTVLGAIIIVAAVALAIAEPYLIPAEVSAFSYFSAVGTVALIGASLLLSGISRLISPQPGLGQSYLLNGNLNTSGQGTPVPLVYGRTRVGSLVVASSYSAEDYNTSTSDFHGAAPFWNSTGGYSGALDAFDSGNPLPSGAQGKGGGGKSGGGGIEAPNTLESKSVVRIIDILTEGPMGGLVNGPQSIFFNNTPLMNSDGTWNFRGVTWYVLYGTPDQVAIPGYPSATETVSVNEQVLYGTPVILDLESTTATSTRITIELPGLYATNTQNGDINPSYLGLEIYCAPVIGTTTGTYSLAVTDIISGKCTSPYQRSYVFALPGAGSGTTSWSVKIVKTTPESAVSTTINQLYWFAYDLITDHQIAYSDSAGIALEIDSEAFGSTLPARSYLIDGIIVEVPANYNATTRTYASTGPGTSGGSWDYVTFQAETTSNPAWCFYDFIKSARYGLGLPAAQLETAALQLYQISQYCDGLVTTGGSGTEPRYELNGVFNQRASAFQLMQAIAATFRGQAYWAGGQVCVTADMPQNPVKIYTAANVINGNFVYEGTSLKTRHTTANVHFTDPNNQYLPGVEPVELPQQVAQRGIFASDIVGFGVTSRGLAHRLGNWLLYTENFQTETVTFSVSWDSAGVAPGNLILIADSNIAGIRMGGRLRSNSTTTQLALDMPFTPVSGQSYTATVVLEDGTLAESVTVSSFTNTNVSSVPYILSEDFLAETAISSPLISLSRSTSATYINSSGGVSTAAANVARFDYANGSPGLLLEQAATNLCPNSNLISNAFTYPGIVANSGVAPDGTTTATKITSNGGGVRTQYAVGATLPNTYTQSIWVKGATASTQSFYFSYNNSGGSQVAAPTNVSITTSWQRIVLPPVSVPSGATDLMIQINTAGTSVFYLWGAQCELGSVATSTILTSGSSVTRAADTLYANLTQSVASGTLIAEAIAPGGTSGAAYGALSLHNGLAPVDNVSMSFAANGVTSGSIEASGVTSSLSSSTITPGASVREAISWGFTGLIQQAINGTFLDGITTSSVSVNLNQITVTAQNPFYLNRIVLYPYARVGADLAAISLPSFDPNSEAQVGASYTIANLATPLPSPPLDQAVFILQDANSPPTEWQVSGITEKERGIFEIVAVSYNPNKFSLVETLQTLNIPVFSTVPSQLISALPAPTNVTAITTLAGQGVTTIVRTTVSWTVPQDSRIVQYQVSVVNAEGTTVAVLTPTGASVVIDNLTPDTYYFAVRSLGTNGSTSSWAYSSSFVISGTSNNTPPAPTGLTAVGGNRSVYLQWVASTQRDVQYNNVWRSSTSVAPHQSGSIAALIGTTSGTAYLDGDSQTLTPGTFWYYWVEAVTSTAVVGALSADVEVEIGYILGSDIGNGAIATINAFAAQFQPIGVWTGTSLPANPAAAGGATTIVWQSNFTVYTWNTTSSAWQTGVTPNLLTAGTLNAGVVLGSLANFGTVQITNAQIENATITGTLIAAHAITQTSELTLSTQTFTLDDVSASGSLSITVPSDAYVLLFVTAYGLALSSGGDGYVADGLVASVARGGTTICNVVLSGSPSFIDPVFLGETVTSYDGPGSGTYSYELSVNFYSGASPAEGQQFYASLVAMVVTK